MDLRALPHECPNHYTLNLNILSHRGAVAFLRVLCHGAFFVLRVLQVRRSRTGTRPGSSVSPREESRTETHPIPALAEAVAVSP
jgi:hypothetical protein